MALLDRFLHRRHPENNPTVANSETGSKDMAENTAAFEESETDREKLVSGLTDREYDFYLLLVEGFSPKECAQMLKLRYSDAKACISELFLKLKVSTRAELIINYRGIRKVKEKEINQLIRED